MFDGTHGSCGAIGRNLGREPVSPGPGESLCSCAPDLGIGGMRSAEGDGVGTSLHGCELCPSFLPGRGWVPGHWRG